MSDKAESSEQDANSRLDPIIAKRAEPLPDEPVKLPDQVAIEAQEEPSDDNAEPVEAAEPEAAEAEKAETETDDAESDEETGEDKPKRRRRSRSRRERRELQRENENLRQQVEALTTAVQKPAEAPNQAAEQAQAPSLDDYEDVDQWAKALASYTDEQVKSAREQVRAELTAEKAQSSQVAKKQAWDVAEEAVAAEFDDYDDVIAGLYLPQGHPAAEAVARSLFESENGPRLAYHLGAHENDTRRMLEMSPLAAVRELGRLEASLTAEQAAPQKPAPKAEPRSITRAPAPPPQVNAAGKVERDPSKMSYAEYRKMRLNGNG